MLGPTLSRRAVISSVAGIAFAGRAVAAMSVTVLKAEDGRDVLVSIWPSAGPSRGVILFSHGALSAPEKYPRLIVPWTEAGFEVLAPLHVDSTFHPDTAKYKMLETWSARLLDMRALSAFVDAPSYIAAGHSYGALVALTLGGAEGEVPPGVKPPLRDRRADCVVALSPPGISPGLISQKGYAALAVPALIETGDRDIPYNSKDGQWQVHLAAYDAAPAGDKYALVLEGVDHYFGGLICEQDKPGPAQDKQLAQTIALSTVFMEAYGLHDAKAKQKLTPSLDDTGPVRLSRK